MQGRLSPPVGGRIQAFPAAHWQEEFRIAAELHLPLLEWTLDQDGLRSNPLLTPDGRRRIAELSERHSVRVSSVTGDCFMQAPFWKETGESRERLLDDFRAVGEASGQTGIGIVVVPLVDNGRIESRPQEDDLVARLQAEASWLRGQGVRVAFESDFPPSDLARFIDRLAPDVFGVNYDIGNSAALGFSPADEVAAYGNRIVNVHVKDRVRGGATVPLGEGAADFDAAFSALARAAYAGPFILQTARAADGDHIGALARYRDFTAGWISRYPSHDDAA
jgi:hexulose-6-phosphate isomerase